ncbi:MAG TPA: hypothetical protein VFH58_15035 [Acidimicrobiales bacterium]|nr:hypothetical protein [Acidimicrobiales bacterium]
MNLEMTERQASELDALLEAALRELSYEIAATDNARHRAEMAARRDRLAEVAAAVHALVRPRAFDEAEAVERELSHPGA